MSCDQPVDVDRLHLERMLAREGEQPLHQRRGALGGLAAIGRASRGCGPGPRSAAQREVEIADDDGEQIVEVVRDAAGEAADRFHLLRLAQRVLGRLAPRDLLRAASRWSTASRRVGAAPRCRARSSRAVAGTAEDQVTRHACDPRPRDVLGVDAGRHVDVDARQLAESEDAAPCRRAPSAVVMMPPSRRCSPRPAMNGRRTAPDATVCAGVRDSAPARYHPAGGSARRRSAAAAWRSSR